MKKNDIVYFVDRGAKYYFNMRFIEKEHIDRYNVNLYKCEILMNDYKFKNKSYAPNFNLRGKIDGYSILSIVRTKKEAEQAIK